MTKNVFIGVNNVSRKMHEMYIGVNGTARKVKAAYIGVNGIARQFWPAIVAPIITTATLPSGTDKTAYSTTLTANEGTGVYAWSASGLPAGLSINTSTGFISGILNVNLTANKNYTVTVKVTSGGLTGQKSFNLTINKHPNYGQTWTGNFSNWTWNCPITANYWIGIDGSTGITTRAISAGGKVTTNYYIEQHISSGGGSMLGGGDVTTYHTMGRIYVNGVLLWSGELGYSTTNTLVGHTRQVNVNFSSW